MVLVDTNVLIDALQNDPRWADWSIGQMRVQSRVHELVVNPVVYAEFAMSFQHPTELDRVLEILKLRLLDVPRPALFLAGKAFARYRREGGPRQSVLADFFIGAHAAVSSLTILTRDARRYRNYFPSVQLVTPA